MKHIVLLLLFAVLLPLPGHAQIDPILTGMIIEYTKKAEAQYNAQIKLMGAESAGHIWLNEEVAATKDLQKQFDDYLSTFRTTIAYAAQAYGFYFEVNRLCEHMGSLSKQISEAPANAIAVALHKKRNDIYISILTKSMGIINTIREVCLDKKMTEQQRISLVFSIRPQLKAMNHQLAMLTKLVRSTTMGLVWHNIEFNSLPHREGRAGLIEECLDTWRVNAKHVKPKK